MLDMFLLYTFLQFKIFFSVRAYYLYNEEILEMFIGEVKLQLLESDRSSVPLPHLEAVLPWANH